VFSCLVKAGVDAKDLLVGVSTSLGTTTWTIRTSIVRVTGPVIVTKFNNDKISFFEQVSDFVEAIFACEAAGRTASKGFVDDGEFEGVV
jgi:hypothetical protein